MFFLKLTFFLYISFGLAFEAFSQVSFRTANLEVRTLNHLSPLDLDFAYEISKASKREESIDALGAPIEMESFFVNMMNLEEARLGLSEHQSFFIALGAFYEGQIVGAVLLSTSRSLGYREGLHVEGHADHAQEKWVEYARFVLPEYQGRGFGKELANGNQSFAFEELYADGVVATAYYDNGASIQTNLKSGLRPVSSSHFDSVISSEERVFFIKRSTYERRACIRLLN